MKVFIVQGDMCPFFPLVVAANLCVSKRQ